MWFIQPCRYAEWVSNIVPIEKKDFEKIRVCIDFRDLNRATLKDEYPMPIADKDENRRKWMENSSTIFIFIFFLMKTGAGAGQPGVETVAG
jgi:hypothetical protein